MTKYNDFKELKEWLYKPKIVRKNVKKTQLFFKVKTNLIVLDLVKVWLDYCKTNRIGVTTKVTNPENTKKVEYVSGVNINIGLA